MKLTIAVTVAFSLLGSSVAYPGLRPLNVDKAIRPTGNSVASTPGSVNEMSECLTMEPMAIYHQATARANKF